MRLRFLLPLRRLGGTRRRLLALSVAAVLLGSLMPVIAASAEVTAYSQQTVAWGPCSWLPSGVPGPVPECATVTVPRDWARPESGPTLSVAISRVRASEQTHRKGILFTNPGGPGGSGISLSWQIATAQPKLAAQYDIIGMDPRGVGFSTQLLCDVPVGKVAGLPVYDSRDLSAQAIATQQTVQKLIADSCAANPLTQYINTWQTTHDMDLIRALLGESKLNYLGYSYGTWLGAKYAAVFPENTGKVVLDSNATWMEDLAKTWENMPMAFQMRWERQFVPWANRNPVVAKYVGTTPAEVHAAYEQVRAGFAKLSGSPVWADFLDSTIRSSLYTDNGFIVIAYYLAVYKVCLVDGPDQTPDAVDNCAAEFGDKFVEELFGSAITPEEKSEVRADIKQAFTAAAWQDVRPDTVPSVLASVHNATGDVVRISGVYFAVRCGDGGQWHTPQWWVDKARQLGPAFPLDGYVMAQEVCGYWTLPSHPLPSPSSQKVDTIVAVQSEFDPATSYLNVVSDVARFPLGTRLISVDDAGAHGQYGIRGNGCVDDMVNDYLLKNVTPPNLSVCAAVPLPLESSVHATPGPVDFVPRLPVHVTPIDPRIRHLLDKIIK